jgi:diguanylate cyclase (GGDEF)-like protein/PAS domain S-box-containing protein
VSASGESSRLLARLRGRPEIFLSCAVTYALHVFGFAVPGNYWVFVALLFGCAVPVRLVGVWRSRPGAPPFAGRLETALQFALTVLVVCLSGWAPLLHIGFVVLIAIRLNELIAAWRFTMILCAGAIGLVQLGIMTGVVPTYLPDRTATGTGLLTGMCVLMVVRMLGVNARARAEAEAAARRSEERFRTVVQDSWDVIIIMDAAGEMVFVSDAVEHVMGWSLSEYRALAADSRVHPDDAATTAAIAGDLAGGTPEIRTELRLRHGDGSWHWHEVLIRNLLTHPAVQGIVVNHRDVTAHKEREEHLAHEATHDPLTGLANRTALRDRLNAWCASTPPVAGAVLFVDLDGFKRVNDEFGHAAGDEVLTTTARQLQDCVPAGDTVARLGGDEFAVLLTGAGGPRDAVAVADRILTGLTAAGIRASIGIAMCEPGRLDARETLHRADQAMYDAKRLGDHAWILHGHADGLLGAALR